MTAMGRVIGTVTYEVGLLALGVESDLAELCTLRNGLCLIGGPAHAGPPPEIVLADGQEGRKG